MVHFFSASTVTNWNVLKNASNIFVFISCIYFIGCTIGILLWTRAGRMAMKGLSLNNVVEENFRSQLEVAQSENDQQLQVRGVRKTG